MLLFLFITFAHEINVHQLFLYIIVGIECQKSFDIIVNISFFDYTNKIIYLLCTVCKSIQKFPVSHIMHV